MLSNTIPAEPPFSQPRVINTAEKAGKKPYVAPRINFVETLEIVAALCGTNSAEGSCIPVAQS